MLSTSPSRDRVVSGREHDRDLRGGPLGRASRGRADRHDHVDLLVALQGARRRFRRRRIASGVAQEQSDMPAFFEPGRLEPSRSPSMLAS